MHQSKTQKPRLLIMFYVWLRINSLLIEKQHVVYMFESSRDSKCLLLTTNTCTSFDLPSRVCPTQKLCRERNFSQNLRPRWKGKRTTAIKLSCKKPYLKKVTFAQSKLKFPLKKLSQCLTHKLMCLTQTSCLTDSWKSVSWKFQRT